LKQTHSTNIIFLKIRNAMSIQIKAKGSLKQFGYAALDMRAQRHLALSDALDEFGKDKLLQKLRALSNLTVNKSNYAHVHQAYLDDIEWVGKQPQTTNRTHQQKGSGYDPDKPVPYIPTPLNPTIQAKAANLPTCEPGESLIHYAHRTGLTYPDVMYGYAAMQNRTSFVDPGTADYSLRTPDEVAADNARQQRVTKAWNDTMNTNVAQQVAGQALDYIHQGSQVVGAVAGAAGQEDVAGAADAVSNSTATVGHLLGLPDDLSDAAVAQRVVDAVEKAKQSGGSIGSAAETGSEEFITAPPPLNLPPLPVAPANNWEQSFDQLHLIPPHEINDIWLINHELNRLSAWSMRDAPWVNAPPRMRAVIRQTRNEYMIRRQEIQQGSGLQTGGSVDDWLPQISILQSRATGNALNTLVSAMINVSSNHYNLNYTGPASEKQQWQDRFKTYIPYIKGFPANDDVDNMDILLPPLNLMKELFQGAQLHELATAFLSRAQQGVAHENANYNPYPFEDQLEARIAEYEQFLNS
jgi:hypothetical protein